MYRQVISIITLFFSTVTQLKSDAVKFLLYSGLLALTIFSLVLYFTYKFAGIAGNLIAEAVPWTWAKESTFFSLLIGFAMIVMAFMVLKYILLILMSPLLSIISEKAEKQITGMSGGAGFSFAGSTARSVRINMRNLLKELVFTILLLMVGLVPGINIIVVPLLFVIQAYFVGFGIMDFYLERHYSFSQTLSKVYNNRWAAVVLGAIFILLFLIPVLGVVAAPYFTTVTATRYFINEVRNENKVSIQM